MYLSLPILQTRELILTFKSGGLHRKHINTMCVQNVPRSKHSVSVIATSQLMLCSEIIVVCSQIHTKHTNTLCGQNAEFFNAKLGGT
jgi:hypothetical protein